MNHRQHNSTHLQRLLSALLPGGFWHLGQFLADVCSAERVAIPATRVKAMRKRDINRGHRNA